MASKSKKPTRLTREMHELAGGMRAAGTMDDSTYRKITMRDLAETEAVTRSIIAGLS